MTTNQPTKEINLASAKELGTAVRKVFETSKQQSDEQIVALQRSNKAKRDAKKPR
jgi:hypothetical protein